MSARRYQTCIFEKERDLDGNTKIRRNSLTRLMNTFRLYRIRSKALVDRACLLLLPVPHFPRFERQRFPSTCCTLRMCFSPSSAGILYLAWLGDKKKTHVHEQFSFSFLLLVSTKRPGHRQSWDWKPEWEGMESCALFLRAELRFMLFLIRVVCVSNLAVSFHQGAKGVNEGWDGKAVAYQSALFCR